MEPRIALSRIVQAAEGPSDVLARWLAEPALPWGQELIVQTPAAAQQREVMRMLADEVLPELDAARLVTS